MPTKGCTTREIVADARAAGHDDADQRLVSYYTQLGLLDESSRGRSRGRGGGIPRHRPEQQRDLFLTILDQKKRGVRSISTLCNIPVFAWVYYGDFWVPLRQARRALETWANNTERASWDRSMHRARHLIGRVAPELRGDARATLAIDIAKIAHGGPYDPKKLTKTLRKAAGPENEFAVGEATHYLTDNYVGQISAQVRARAHLEEISDDLFRVARAELRKAPEEYRSVQPTLAADPRLQRHADTLTSKDLAANACPNLMLMLGLLLEAGDKPNTAIVKAS